MARDSARLADDVLNLPLDVALGANVLDWILSHIVDDGNALCVLEKLALYLVVELHFDGAILDVGFVYAGAFLPRLICIGFRVRLLGDHKHVRGIRNDVRHRDFHATALDGLKCALRCAEGLCLFLGNFDIADHDVVVHGGVCRILSRTPSGLFSLTLLPCFLGALLRLFFCRLFCRLLLRTLHSSLFVGGEALGVLCRQHRQVCRVLLTFLFQPLLLFRRPGDQVLDRGRIGLHIFLLLVVLEEVCFFRPWLGRLLYSRRLLLVADVACAVIVILNLRVITHITSHGLIITLTLVMRHARLRHRFVPWHKFLFHLEELRCIEVAARPLFAEFVKQNRLVGVGVESRLKQSALLPLLHQLSLGGGVLKSARVLVAEDLVRPVQLLPLGRHLLEARLVTRTGGGSLAIPVLVVHGGTRPAPLAAIQ